MRHTQITYRLMRNRGVFTPSQNQSEPGSPEMFSYVNGELASGEKVVSRSAVVPVLNPGSATVHQRPPIMVVSRFVVVSRRRQDAARQDFTSTS